MPISNTEEELLSVTDVKQYFYCPRILYFDKILHVNQRLGAQQEDSKKEHEKISKKDVRRKAAMFYSPELQQAEKTFHVALISQKLKLQGTLDCLIRTKQEYVPIDYKYQLSNKGHPHSHHKYQLVAYALLVDENYQTVVKRGFIYYVPEKKPIQIETSYRMKRYVQNSMVRIRRQLIEHVLPPIRKCQGACGYEWICL